MEWTEMGKKMITSYWIEVLGCKVNQYDARQIADLLNRFGLKEAVSPKKADLLLVHTCGVTAAAAQKSRQSIRKLERKNPKAVLLVTGCAAPEHLTGVENNTLSRVPAGPGWLQELAKTVKKLSTPSSPDIESIQTDEFSISDFGSQTRAFLKVQDGCDIGCSYCIVPQLRKKPRDKPLKIAVSEAKRMAEKGYREIVITGVSVGLYGRGGEDSLADLLEAILQIKELERIRLSSLHPAELTPQLLEIWASSPRVMPHFHLSLQSGSNAILSAMRRGYTAEEYLEAVNRARSALENPAFTTDIITGFPGETEAHFEETFSFCHQVGFSQMHVFTYSPRPKTHAAKMKHQVPGDLASIRAERLRKLGKELAHSYHRKFIEKTVPVLVENEKEGICSGYSPQYIPVEFPASEEFEFRGKIVQVKGLEASEKALLGQMISL
jgi:threonylcarbamoyladenosine tRNA methylthiotransferase MtaB